MPKRPKKTKPQPAADIETALRVVTEELLDIFSKDKLDKAAKMYREIYPVPPERHLKYFEADDLKKLSEEQLDELYSEVSSDYAAGMLSGKVLSMISDITYYPEIPEPEGGYIELSAEISAFAHEAEREEFLEQARQKYGWNYEPDLFRPTKLSYKPELSPKGRELYFAVEAISLYAQYRRAFMGVASLYDISETILNKAKENTKRKLKGQTPGADITELSLGFEQALNVLVHEESQNRFIQLQQQQKKKEEELK